MGALRPALLVLFCLMAGHSAAATTIEIVGIGSFELDGALIVPNAMIPIASFDSFSAFYFTLADRSETGTDEVLVVDAKGTPRYFDDLGGGGVDFHSDFFDGDTLHFYDDNTWYLSSGISHSYDRSGTYSLVPEPTTALLVGQGLLVLALRQRRRRAR